MNIAITVISYNSSETIADTLDSILVQDYGPKNIELIISDDGSIDDTTDIIDKWLSAHSTSFVNTIFIKNRINKGVTENCNKAWKAINCDWIKTIAGDDTLEPTCITANVEYINRNPECKILFSKMRWFGRIHKVTPSPYNKKFFEMNSEKQNNWLNCFSFNIAPTSFINTEALDKIGYADDRFKTLEDLPLWIKFTEEGYRLHFLDLITVNYRVSESISMSSHKYININFYKDLISINKSQAKSFLKSPLSEIIRNEQLLSFYLILVISNISGNKKNIYTNSLGRTTWILRPIHFLHHAKIKFYNNYLSKVDK